MEICNNVDINELMLKMLDKFEKLTNQVEEMRVHLGLQPPKTIPVDYGTPDKPTAVFIDDIPEIYGKQCIIYPERSGHQCG